MIEFLQANRAGQEIIKIGDKTYSIVDLTIMPMRGFEAKSLIEEQGLENAWKFWQKIHGWNVDLFFPYNIEIADIGSDHITVCGRYKSFDDAREAAVKGELEWQD